MEGSLLPVKLKRKLTKGHYEYNFVDTMHVREALNLKQTNIHYKDVEFNKDWLNEFCRQQENDIQEENDSNVVTGETSAGTGDELLHDRQQHCMFQDMSYAC